MMTNLTQLFIILIYHLIYCPKFIQLVFQHINSLIQLFTFTQY